LCLTLPALSSSVSRELTFRPISFSHTRHSQPIPDKMGYLDDEVKRLQGIINNIEGRVQALEGRQIGGGQKKTAEEVRMILIGPPGAGM